MYPGSRWAGKEYEAKEDRENSMIIKFEFEVHMCTYKFCKSADLKFPVSGRSIDRHTRVQCSHDSVGLAQARPNYIVLT